MHTLVPKILAAAPRAAAAVLLLAIGAVRADGLSPTRVETSMRFLEYDAPRALLAYELTLRNVSNLAVSSVVLTAEPPCLEGPFELADLAREEQASRRFTFPMPADRQVLQPRFELAYTNFEGERIHVPPARSPLMTSVDFAAVDLETGRVSLRVDIQNPGADGLLFIKLWVENPSLAEGTLELGDLGPGERLSREFQLTLAPGELFFNPTLHFSYHAFQAEGTRLHRSFTTMLQPRLDRVAAALAAKATP
jgi:hypothetical protein